MTEREVNEAVAAWVDQLLPELNDTYSFVASTKGELPDCMVEVVEKRTALRDPSFPMSQLQQVLVRVFDVALYFMVENDTEGGADAAETQQLQDFGQRVEASILADATLGDRVQMVSPIMRFNYAQPFVQYQDGVRGRQMEARISVGEVVPQQEGSF